jgi:hypothetical protein
MDALLPFTPDLLCEPLVVLRDSIQFSGSFMLPILAKLALQVCCAAWTCMCRRCATATLLCHHADMLMHRQLQLPQTCTQILHMTRTHVPCMFLTGCHTSCRQAVRWCWWQSRRVQRTISRRCASWCAALLLRRVCAVWWEAAGDVRALFSVVRIAHGVCPLLQGVNMAAHMQSGQLTVVDALTDVGILSEAELHAGAPQLISRILAAIGRAHQQPHAAAVEADSGTSTAVAAQPAARFSTNGLHAQADASSNAGRWFDGKHEQQLQPAVSVLVDDLTAVGSLIADDTGWRGLLKQLLAIVTAEQQSHHLSIGSGSHRADGSATHGIISGPVSMCVLLHADVEDAAAAELLTSDAANVIVDIEPLTAGQSADVSGRINMQLRDCTAGVPWGISETDCERRFFVKVSDRGVRFLQQYTAA